MKGDAVEVLVDTGAGQAQTFKMVATKDGRKLDVRTSAREVVIVEQTRGNRDVRTWRFQAARALAVMEHPAEEVPLAERRKRTLPPGHEQLKIEGAA